MEIKDLVNRFELLEPNNQNLIDLRRSYIDKDLSSIFRLVADNSKEDLRKFIMEDNIWSLWKLLFSYTDTHFVSALKNFHVNEIAINLDCLSQGQIKSKRWLIDELVRLDLDLGTVFLCAGWYATLATMLFESGIKIDKIRSFDLDPSCITIAEVFNKPWIAENWNFKSITENILNIDYNSHSWTSWSTANNRMSNPITDIPNTIINTSCEHIENFDKWYNLIPKDKIVILQTNNYIEIEDHVNCSNNLEEFRLQSPMANVLYEGELLLDKYTRYMRIGIK